MLKISMLMLLLSGMSDKESLRFSHCPEQGFDSSCGLSVLACLMERYWACEETELTLASAYLSEKMASGDLSISFADMARMLDAKGFLWKAYKMEYGQLLKAIRSISPLILHYEKPDGHFALLLSANENWLIIADPAEGGICIGRQILENRWSGAVLAAVKPEAKLNKSFLYEAIQVSASRNSMMELASRETLGALSW